MIGTIIGVLMALFLNNGGGAWDNAKKYIELGNFWWQKFRSPQSQQLLVIELVIHLKIQLVHQSMF